MGALLEWGPHRKGDPTGMGPYRNGDPIGIGTYMNGAL